MIESILALAIYMTGATPHEQRLLMSIARHESGLRHDVVTCRVLGDGGRARGAFQIHPRSASERRDACDVVTAPVIALARVRESLAACGDLTGYVSGRCGVGVLAAKVRWVE